jgi:hypothetical protein
MCILLSNYKRRDHVSAFDLKKLNHECGCPPSAFGIDPGVRWHEFAREVTEPFDRMIRLNRDPDATLDRLFAADASTIHKLDNMDRQDWTVLLLSHGVSLPHHSDPQQAWQKIRGEFEPAEAAKLLNQARTTPAASREFWEAFAEIGAPKPAKAAPSDAAAARPTAPPASGVPAYGSVEHRFSEKMIDHASCEYMTSEKLREINAECGGPMPAFGVDPSVRWREFSIAVPQTQSRINRLAGEPGRRMEQLFAANAGTIDKLDCMNRSEWTAMLKVHGVSLPDHSNPQDAWQTIRKEFKPDEAVKLLNQARTSPAASQNFWEVFADMGAPKPAKPAPDATATDAA